MLEILRSGVVRRLSEAILRGVGEGTRILARRRPSGAQSPVASECLRAVELRKGSPRYERRSGDETRFAPQSRTHAIPGEIRARVHLGPVERAAARERALVNVAVALDVLDRHVVPRAD